MSQAIFAKGTQLSSEGDTPGTFELIKEIRTITGPDMNSESIDATSHDTPGGFRDWKQGLKTWGTVTFEMLWIPSEETHQRLFEDFKVSPSVERKYRIVYPDPDNYTFSFTGFVTSCPINSPFDQLLTRNVVIQIVGDPEPTFAPATP